MSKNIEKLILGVLIIAVVHYVTTKLLNHFQVFERTVAWFERRKKGTKVRRMKANKR